MRIAKIIQSIRQPNFGNWKAVALAVAAATTFWFFHSLNQNYTSSISYPIKIEYPEESYIVTSSLPNSVLINVTGIGWNIFRKSLSLNIPPVILRLENPAEVKKIVGAVLLPQINDQLDDIKVNYIITDTLHVNIEHKRSRKLAVKVDSATISLKTNYRIVSNVVPTPDSILITGPKSIIENLPESLPMPIDEREIDENFDELVPFRIRGYNQPLLTITPNEINVKFEVAEFQAIVMQLIVNPVNFPEEGKIYLSDTLTNVTMVLAKKDVAQLQIDSIRVEADYLRLNKLDSTIIPNIARYPNEILLIALDTVGLKLRYE